MFKVLLESTISGSKQYMWTLYSPSGTVICYSNLYDLPKEAQHNAELFVKHFNTPSSLCTLDAKSVEEITGQGPSKTPLSLVNKKVERNFTLLKGDKD